MSDEKQTAEAKDAETVLVKLNLPQKIRARLHAFATMNGMKIGEAAAKILDEHLPNWESVASDRRPTQAEGRETGEPASERRIEMSELSRVLEEVRKKLVAYRDRELNEQDTKTALIDPVLRALGWHVGDLEEVSQEYKLKPQDKPVDYAFFLVRTPKLFLEAKARGQNLEDRKWAGQIMGYAAVAGVKWTVITNGDEYRIYNACVDVPVDEKMFRAVKISDGTSTAEETLALLSKDRIRDNDIEILWKAHFVDRQVRLALEELIAAEKDSSLIRLLKKKVTELSPKDIRASLARVRVRFDFPIESEPPEAGESEAATKRSEARGRHGTLAATLAPLSNRNNRRSQSRLSASL